MSGKVGSARVAATQLLVSGVCCVISPFFFQLDISLFILFLLIWGITVIGDSPQFSTLNAEHAPREYVGSALTIVNSIGFFITVVSVQLVSFSTAGNWSPVHFLVAHTGTFIRFVGTQTSLQKQTQRLVI